MKNANSNKVLEQFKDFLELEMISLKLSLKLLKSKKKKTHTFRVIQKDKVIVQVPINTNDLNDPKVKNLNITLQIGQGVEKDQKLLANASAALVSYIKIYKDLLDNHDEELDFYQTYFKLARQKWLGEIKN